MSVRKPIPDTDSEIEAKYWAKLAAGSLPLQSCNECKNMSHPPRIYCPQCHSKDWDFEAASGLGTVYSQTIVQRPSSDRYEPPVHSVIIELSEGPRVMGIINESKSNVSIGDDVELKSNELCEENVRLIFETL